MRLICPNCGAQYEIDDNLIPAAGRDVQCSDCGTAWFQKGAAQIAAEEEARRAEAASRAQEMSWAETSQLAGETEREEAAQAPAAPPEPEQIPDIQPEPEPEPEPAVSQVPPTPESRTAEEAEPEPERETQLTFKRRVIDETTLSVLREEAERETQARIAEGTATEQIQPQEEQAPERSLQVRNSDEPASAPEAVTQDDDRSSRKELLPDIEQINSTLRPTSSRGDEAVSRDAPQNLRRYRASFRFGFITAIAAIGTLVLLYAFAPEIVTLFPGSEAAMSSYLQATDGLRKWLETMVLAAAEGLGGPNH